MVARKGDKSGEEILEKMNEITRDSAAHTDELVKSVGSLIAEQTANLEAILKDAEDKIGPEVASLQKTIELVEKTTDRVDKVLMGEAKRMEKSLLAADGKSGVVEGVEKEKSAQTGSDEGEEGEVGQIGSHSPKAVHFQLKSARKGGDGDGNGNEDEDEDEAY